MKQRWIMAAVADTFAGWHSRYEGKSDLYINVRTGWRLCCTWDAHTPASLLRFGRLSEGLRYQG